MSKIDEISQEYHELKKVYDQKKEQSFFDGTIGLLEQIKEYREEIRLMQAYHHAPQGKDWRGDCACTKGSWIHESRAAAEIVAKKMRKEFDEKYYGVK